MLNNAPFYYQMTRKYITVIAHIFSDITIQRFNDKNILIKDITVPVTFAGKTKMFQLIERDVGATINTILPRISFMLNSMEIDPERSENAVNTIQITNDGYNEEFIYAAKPYNFNFSVSVWAKYVDDLLQIVEQIAVFFNPDYSVTVDEIRELGLKKDITINLNEISLNLSTEYDEQTEREVTADISLTLNGYLYPPIKNQKVIRVIRQNVFADYDDEDYSLDNTVNNTFNDDTSDIDTNISDT